ncbi:MAG: tetratricopeptide (TPR) repeat protein, partial [Planctomycetaceae bacterium]
MGSGRGDWQSHRQDMQGGRQDWRSNHREDWQGWADGHIHNHGGFYHGCWNGGWHPGAGWNHMWDNYPVATAFGLTAWGVNRMAYGFGYWGYSNPYESTTTVYNYSEPIVVYEAGGGAADPAAAPESDTATIKLEQARAAFHSGNLDAASRRADEAVKASPNDTVVHEFRGLVLFALKEYSESAAATYAVLSAGPGWDWTTMSSLYPSVDVYTQQLRALEEFSQKNPDSADAHFLLGYHYLTGTHAEAASREFKLAQAQLPNDKLLA